MLASVLLAGSIAAPSLPADDASSWLRWNAPLGCPDRDHVARVVTRRLLLQGQQSTVMLEDGSVYLVDVRIAEDAANVDDAVDWFGLFARRMP